MMSSAGYDEEAGIRPSEHRPDLPKSSSFRQRLFGQGPAVEVEEEVIDPDRFAAMNELVSQKDKLALFRRLTGITSGDPLAKKGILKRPVENPGIYHHVSKEEETAKHKYVFFSRLINFCLGLQIIVAAALTALGAGDGPHAVVTVFGAINTVIAGFLTYLKGSGLPNRTKFYQNEWGRLRDHIEQQERNFSCQGCEANVYEEVKIIEKMYKEIRDEIEANTPDAYTSVRRAKEQEREVNHTPVTKPTNSETSETSGSGIDQKVG